MFERSRSKKVELLAKAYAHANYRSIYKMHKTTLKKKLSFLLDSKIKFPMQEILLLFCFSMLTMLSPRAIKNYTIDMEIRKQEIIGVRLPYENIKEFISFMDWKTDRVYLINQGDSGEGNVLGGYLATPIDFGGWGWSLGKPLYDGDVWKVEQDLEGKFFLRLYKSYE